MKTRFDFSGDDFQVTVDFKHAKDPLMSLPGIVDAYAAYFPISESTKAKLTNDLYKQAATKISHSFRFITGVLHQQVDRGHSFWIDIDFKGYTHDFCRFDIAEMWYRQVGGKHEVMLYVRDYMANGAIDEYWKRQARAKTKK